MTLILTVFERLSSAQVVHREVDLATPESVSPKEHIGKQRHKDQAHLQLFIITWVHNVEHNSTELGEMVDRNSTSQKSVHDA